jgi:hypothetical protein
LHDEVVVQRVRYSAPDVAANSKILNYDRFQRNSAKVAGYCKSHKSETLPTAIKNLGLWQ